MSTRRWLLVILSFATAFGVSAWVVISSWPHGGSTRSLPLAAHLLALALSLVDIVARAVKLHWSARSIGFRLPMRPALRATIGGDFGGAITPSRSGTEPARFLLLSEAKVGAGNAVVVIFTELALEIAGLVVLALAAVFVVATLRDKRRSDGSMGDQTGPPDCHGASPAPRADHHHH